MQEWNRWHRWVGGILGILLPLGGIASDEASRVRDSLKQHLPDLVIEEVSATPVAGLYQVVAGTAILYVTADGRYAFSGDMIDLGDRRSNLTEKARQKTRLAGLKSLGEKNMVIFSPKNPKYTVTVFTDVDCGYCRKLQADIPELNAKGIAVRYLAFPRTGPNTPTFEKMVRIWCAKDKTKAMALAQEDKSFEGVACNSDVVQREFEYGMRIGVEGTPTLLFEDGTLFPGYLPPDKLLEAAKKIRENMLKQAT